MDRPRVSIHRSVVGLVLTGATLAACSATPSASSPAMASPSPAATSAPTLTPRPTASTAPPSPSPSPSSRLARACVDAATHELLNDFGQDVEGVGGALGHSDRSRALTEARLAASEARELTTLAESTWPEAVEHLRLSAEALDRVAVAIAAEADVNPWYQTAWAEEDAARGAILSAGRCWGR